MGLKYWTNANYAAVNRARTFKELEPIALEVIARMPTPRGTVCGPISTGGLGSIEANLREFHRRIEELESMGHSIYTQMPFEGRILQLKDEWYQAGNTGYCMPILEDFYGPVFKSGLLQKAWFIPGWKNSFGSRWEHATLSELGIQIIYLWPDLIGRELARP